MKSILKQESTFHLFVPKCGSTKCDFTKKVVPKFCPILLWFLWNMKIFANIHHYCDIIIKLTMLLLSWSWWPSSEIEMSNIVNLAWFYSSISYFCFIWCKAVIYYSLYYILFLFSEYKFYYISQLNVLTVMLNGNGFIVYSCIKWKFSVQFYIPSHDKPHETSFC